MERLIEAAQAGDTKALEALWKKTRKLAFTVARRFYTTTYADFDDLQQCAYLGFHAAVMQHTGRYRFLSLVQWCTQRECQKLLDLYGSRRQVKADSLDILLPDGEHTPADLIEDASLPEHDVQIIASEITRDVRAAVAELPERERAVIETRWLSAAPLSLDQTGDAMGISRERTRQLEARALEHLRTDPVLQTYAPWYNASSSLKSGLSRFIDTRTSCVEQVALRGVQRSMSEKQRHAQKTAYADLLESLAAEGYLSPEELPALLGK